MQFAWLKHMIICLAVGTTLTAHVETQNWFLSVNVALRTPQIQYYTNNACHYNSDSDIDSGTNLFSVKWTMYFRKGIRSFWAASFHVQKKNVLNLYKHPKNWTHRMSLILMAQNERPVTSIWNNSFKNDKCTNTTEREWIPIIFLCLM